MNLFKTAALEPRKTCEDGKEAAQVIGGFFICKLASIFLLSPPNIKPVAV